MNVQPFDRNIPFNQLPLLPPSREYVEEVDIYRYGMLASRALGELSRNVRRLPNPNMIVNTISLQEAKTSLEIENIFTTGEELYKALAGDEKLGGTNPAIKEVLRYREALWTGFRYIKDFKKFDTSIVIQIYQQVENTSQGIRPPHSDVFIKRGDSEWRSGERIYTPPRGEGIIEDKLNNLLDFLNTETDDIDPLIKMAIAHYQFEAIHPFRDGNGRTGRIINLLYLVQQRLIKHPILYHSKFILENKDEYYHCLSGVTQQSAWKPWIIFMMRAVQHTALHTNNLIDSILDQMNHTFEQARKAKLKWYNREINEAIFTQPYFKMRTIEAAVRKSSRTTLLSYARQLIDLGIIAPKDIGNQTFYINLDLIRILEG